MKFPRTRRSRIVLLLLVAAGALTLVGVALAIDPIPGPVHRGTLVHRINANADHIRVHTDATTDLAAQDVTYPPGASSGWHIHPGVVLVEVEAPAGQGITFHHGCDVHTYTNNQAFHESGDTPVLAENTGSANVTVHAMFIAPTGAALRTNTGPPDC